jgi:hypothetical protein
MHTLTDLVVLENDQESSKEAGVEVEAGTEVSSSPPNSSPEEKAISKASMPGAAIRSTYPSPPGEEGADRNRIDGSHRASLGCDFWVIAAPVMRLTTAHSLSRYRPDDERGQRGTRIPFTHRHQVSQESAAVRVI